MFKTKILAFLLLLLIAISCDFCFLSVKASNESDSISAANTSLNQAFSNVLAAQQEGANVTELLDRLNTAGAFLAQANNSYSAGNLSDVVANANSALSIAKQVNTDALLLKNESTAHSQNSAYLTVAFSISASVVLLVVLSLAWRYFKRSYMKKLPSLRPQGADNTIQ
jgi:hypothetical protein